MKQNLYTGSLILLSTLVFTFACKKSVDQPSPPDTVGNIPQDTTQAAPVIPYPVTPCGNVILPRIMEFIVYAQLVS
jgi:hypothetical protein